jgi:hypothetical protein
MKDSSYRVQRVRENGSSINTEEIAARCFEMIQPISVALRCGMMVVARSRECDQAAFPQFGSANAFTNETTYSCSADQTTKIVTQKQRK